MYTHLLYDLSISLMVLTQSRYDAAPTRISLIIHYLFAWEEIRNEIFPTNELREWAIYRASPFFFFFFFLSIDAPKKPTQQYTDCSYLIASTFCRMDSFT